MTPAATRRRAGRALAVTTDGAPGAGNPPPVSPAGCGTPRLGGGAGVVCLETDQSTEHAPEIRDKLARYEPALRPRAGWHVLFVVETAARAAFR